MGVSQEPTRIFGIPIVIDPTMPSGTWKLVGRSPVPNLERSEDYREMKRRIKKDLLRTLAAAIIDETPSRDNTFLVRMSREILEELKGSQEAEG